MTIFCNVKTTTNFTETSNQDNVLHLKNIQYKNTCKKCVNYPVEIYRA